MNAAATLSRSMALKVMGSLWYIDREKQVIRENLGQGSPPFHFESMFVTLDEARQQDCEGFEVERLPEVIRIPKGSPIAANTDSEMTNARAALQLLCFGDLMRKGLRIERRRVLSVDYAPSPFDLRNRFDFVAVHAIVKEDNIDVRIKIGHDENGNPFVEGMPQARQSWGGWTALTDVLAFMTREAAELHADRMAAELMTAADWRMRG